ncbi:MAG: hypothetical protein GY794_16090 [bacterium]|nr:hypothetical protein [bacterium]
MKMRWRVVDNRTAALLEDGQGLARGGITRADGFMLGFVKSHKGTVKLAECDETMALLGAFPTMQTAGQAVEHEVKILLRTGRYEKIIEQ